jgi:hypothetical protein
MQQETEHVGWETGWECQKYALNLVIVPSPYCCKLEIKTMTPGLQAIGY